MKRLAIAATALFMLVGTSAFAAGKGKTHKKHHARHMHHAKKDKAEAAPKAAPAKK